MLTYSYMFCTDTEELVLPSMLVLNSWSIVHAGPTIDIAGALSSVQDLDISMNAIAQWQEVGFTGNGLCV